MTNIKILKDLTQTTYDSVEGYRNAAEKADSPTLKRALETRLGRRQQTLAKLNTALTNHNEQPINSTSVAGSGHQMYLKIASAFENDNEAAAEHVEEGEDYLAGKFRDALKDDLKHNDPVRPIIEDAYNEIREGERMTDMLEKQYS